MFSRNDSGKEGVCRLHIREPRNHSNQLGTICFHCLFQPLLLMRLNLLLLVQHLLCKSPGHVLSFYLLGGTISVSAISGNIQVSVIAIIYGSYISITSSSWWASPTMLLALISTKCNCLQLSQSLLLCRPREQIYLRQSVHSSQLYGWSCTHSL